LSSRDRAVIIVGFDDYAAQCRNLALALGAPLEFAQVRRFPDGESLVNMPAALPEEVVLCRSLDWPNDKLVELMLTARTARELGARHLTLVAPYLCYMRQDAAFHPGEAISQRIVGRFLADLFDQVVTVDPHLHRTDRLGAAVPARIAVALTAAGAIGEFLRERAPDAFVLGPDAESGQWAAAVAVPGRLECAVCTKTRHGDRDVEIRLPAAALAGRRVVLVDDVASTGRTLATAATQCLDRGASRVDVFVTHAILGGDAVAQLRAAGVGEVWSTDSVTHASNVLPLAEVIAEHLR
jgi:ribose-phosphate pyrophosphokinase